MTDAAREDEITRFKTAFEILQELAPKQRGHDPYRDEKPFPARHPVGSLRRQSAAGHDTMNMGMIHKILSPGVKDADKPCTCAKMSRIIGEFQERLGNRPE